MFSMQTIFRHLLPIFLLGTAYSLTTNQSVMAQTAQPNPSNICEGNNTSNCRPRPRPRFFEESTSATVLDGFSNTFLSDALSGISDPFTSTGASNGTISDRGVQIQIANGNQNAFSRSGIFSVNDVNPSLETAINQNQSNFFGSAGSLNFTGNDGSITNIPVSRIGTNTGRLVVGGNIIDVTINDINATSSRFGADPYGTIAAIATGNGGSVTLNGQPAQVTPALTGNDGVLRFVNASGQFVEIRVDNVAGFTQTDINNLNRNSRLPGGLTFNLSLPDR